MALHITGDDAADELLASDPLALLVGMLLDQQVAMETAFAGPAKIRDRLGAFDAATLATVGEERLTEVFRTPPAVHRYPGSMAARTGSLAQAIVEHWGGDAEAIWTQPDAAGNDPDGAEVLRRLRSLPGFGEQKAKIFLALLGKQRGLTAVGWRESAGAYGEDGCFRSVADIVDPESLTKVRETKRSAKAAAKQ